MFTLVSTVRTHSFCNKSYTSLKTQGKKKFTMLCGGKLNSDYTKIACMSILELLEC